LEIKEARLWRKETKDPAMTEGFVAKQQDEIGVLGIGF
jgi:hypothetical protein